MWARNRRFTESSPSSPRKARGIWAISSELEELMGLCDRILVMCRGRLVADVPRARFDAKPILLAAFGDAR